MVSAARGKMKALRNIFTNPWALFGIVAYAVSLAVLWRNRTFGREDAISELVLFGILFPLLAWLGTLRARPLTVFARRSAGEMTLLGFCLALVAAYLIWGAALTDLLLPATWPASPRRKFLVIFARKLIAFVASPVAIVRF